MSDEELVRRVERLLGGHPLPRLSDDSQRLLTRVQALLIARASLEYAINRGPIEPAETEQQWRLRLGREAVEIFLQADRLLPDIIGDAPFEVLFPSGIEPDAISDIRSAFVRRLKLFRRLLSRPSWGASLNRLIGEIADMSGGDQPEILMPARRNSGQAKQPTKIARKRLGALCWDIHLKSIGVATVERQTAISTAYRTSWEAIRKWRGSCETTFGKEAVEEEVRFATNSFWAEYAGDDWRDQLNADGTDYYETWKNQRGDLAS